MNVTEHRPPLKRIDWGLKPRPPEPPESSGEEFIRTGRELAARIAHERLWGLITQSARGCNAVGGEG